MQIARLMTPPVPSILATDAAAVGRHLEDTGSRGCRGRARPCSRDRRRSRPTRSRRTRPCRRTTWPWPSRFQSSCAQPNAWIIGARNSEQSADASGEHDVGALASASTMTSAPRYALAETISPSSDDERRAALHQRQRVGVAAAIVEHVVAQHRRDLHRAEAELADDLGGLLRRAERIRRAHAGDDTRAVRACNAAARRGSGPRAARCSRRRVLHPLQLRERDRALGQRLVDQIVELAPLGEQRRGLDAIPRVARAGADAQHARTGAAVAIIAAHSPLMFLSLMIRAHFSLSLFRSAASCAGVVGAGSTPEASSFCLHARRSRACGAPPGRCARPRRPAWPWARRSRTSCPNRRR